jgi:hypothetical protein
MALTVLIRNSVACSLIALGACGWSVSGSLLFAQAPPASAAQGASDELKIVVVEGEDGVNIVKKKTAVQPVVEVRDKNDLPVAGATVTFALPSAGPGGTFLNGARSLTMITNSAGRAAVASLHPVGTGAFHIGVSAAFQGHIATVAIAQTNYLTAAASAGAGGAAGAGGGVAGGTAALSTTAIVGIVGGVVAAGAIVAVKVLVKSSPSSAAATPTSIGLGSATVGP